MFEHFNGILLMPLTWKTVYTSWLRRICVKNNFKVVSLGIVYLRAATPYFKWIPLSEQI